MNIKDYSLSVWGEKAVTGQSRLQEYMIAEIGSLSMDSKCAALEPTLTQKVNGEMELTFKMVTQYIEHGGKIKNPFVDFLINDRTIKLHRDGEWYDFVITSIEQDSEDNINTYKCTASHIYELSKNGYGLVYNSEINNDQGTITELAASVLDGTDWYVDTETSEDILEKKRNAVYTIVTNTQISVEEVLTGSTTTIPSGTTIYAFYDSIYNRDDKVQFIYGTDESQLDDNNCVLNWTNYYVTTTYYDGIPTWAESMTYTSTFEGYRYVLVQRNLYDTILDERVDLYEDEDGKEYYRRNLTTYASSAIVNNLTTGAETFTVDSNGDLPGWILVNADPVVESHEGKNWLKLTPNSSSKATYAMNTGLVDNASVAGPLSKGDKLYVRLTLGVNYSSITPTQGENVKVFVKNSTIDANGDYVEGDSQITDTVDFSTRNINPLIPGYFTFNSDNIPVSFTSLTGATPTPNNWIVDLSCANDGSKDNGSYLNFYRVDSSGHFYLTGEGAKFYWSNQNGSFGGDVVLGQSGYIYVFRGNGTIGGTSATTGQMFITTQEYQGDTANSELVYNRITDPSTTTLVNYAWVTLTLNKSLSASDLADSDYKIILKQNSGSTMTLTIGDFYVSKKAEYEVTDVTGSYKRNIQIFVGSTPIGQTLTEYKFYDPDELYAIENLIYVDPTDITGLQPVYNDYKKIRSIEISKSNRFNILQTICEKFEAWIKFTIEHNDNGTIKLDDDGDPIKTVSFHEYIGKDNYAGFVYGLNLDSITRTIDSENIVSKLYVEPNTHEGADDGYCSIQKSDSNALGEEFIYNFDYYLNRGLLDSSVKEEIYGDDGYFTRIAEINRPRNQLIRAQSLVNISYQKVESNRSVIALSIDKTTNDIEVERAKLLAWDINIPQAYHNIPEASAIILGACNGDYIQSDGTFIHKTPDSEIIAIVESINEHKRRLALAKINLTNAEQEVARLYNQMEDIQDQLDDIQSQKDAIFEEFENKYSHYIREGSWSSEDYGDSDLYYLDAVIVSQTNAQPKVEYQIKVTDISAIEGYEYIDFAIGDKTTVEDADFFGPGIKQSVIISELKRVLDDPSQDDITVQNYKTQFEDLFSRIEASIQTVEMKEGAYNRAASVVGNNGAIDVEAMVNSLYQLGQSGLGNTNPVSNITQDSEGLTSIDKNSSYKQLKIMDGKIYMTNNGGISWEPVVTSEGINVSYLKAGKIDTSQINIMSGNSAKFIWDKVGINAYSTDSTSGDVDYAKFVRLDQYGLYGLNANSGNNYYLSYSFEPSSINDVLNNEAITFALTWKGFLLRSKKNSGTVSSLFTIDSDNGLTFNYNKENSGTTDQTIIQLGNLGNNKYGLLVTDGTTGSGNERLFAGRDNNTYDFRIKDANGNNLFTASGLGNNTVGDNQIVSTGISASKVMYGGYSIEYYFDGFAHVYSEPSGTEVRDTVLQYYATEPALYMRNYTKSGSTYTPNGAYIRLGGKYETYNDGLSLIDGTDGAILSNFGSTSARIGKKNNNHLNLFEDGIEVKNYNVINFDFESETIENSTLSTNNIFNIAKYYPSLSTKTGQEIDIYKGFMFVLGTVSSYTTPNNRQTIFPSSGSAYDYKRIWRVYSIALPSSLSSYTIDIEKVQIGGTLDNVNMYIPFDAFLDSNGRSITLTNSQILSIKSVFDSSSVTVVLQGVEDIYNLYIGPGHDLDSGDDTISIGSKNYVKATQSAIIGFSIKGTGTGENSNIYAIGAGITFGPSPDVASTATVTNSSIVGFNDTIYSSDTVTVGSGNTLQSNSSSSSIIGFNTSLSGISVRAFSNSSTIAGNYSNFIGYNLQVSGSRHSTILGENITLTNKSNNDYVYVIGYNNQSTVTDNYIDNSAVFGCNNTIVPISSSYGYHNVYGSNNRSTGANTGLFGYNNIGNGTYVYNFGSENKAVGTYVTISGYQNAIGDTVKVQSSSIFGNENHIYTNYSFSIGARNRSYCKTSENPESTVSDNNGSKYNTLIGRDNQTVGQNNTLLGINNICIGDDRQEPTPMSSYPYRAGNIDYVINNNSIFGVNNDFAGNNNTIVGISNNINSYSTPSTVYYNTVLGRANNYCGYNNTIIGFNNTKYGTAVGSTYYNNAVLGVNNVYCGYRITLVGDQNKVNNTSSACIYAFGVQNEAQGNGNIVVGGYNTVTDITCIDNCVVGISNTISAGYKNAIFGYGNTNSGNYSTVVGYNNTNSGTYNAVIGYNNTITQSSVTAIGKNLMDSSSLTGVFLGINNQATSAFPSGYNTILTIGNGWGDSHRHNALQITSYEVGETSASNSAIGVGGKLKSLYTDVNLQGLVFKNSSGSFFGAIGINSSYELIYGNTANFTNSHRWYSSNTNIMTLSNAGNLSINGNYYVNNNHTYFAYDTGGTARTIANLNSSNYYNFATGGMTNRVLIGTTDYSDFIILRGKKYKLNSTTGADISSDRRIKKDFSELTPYERFYMDLKPLSYKYKFGTSGRTHVGFIAQEVEEALTFNGLSTKEFGGIVKSEHCEEINEETGEKTEYEKIFEKEGIKEGDTEYGLIYEEFIALNTHMIQKLYKRIDELEAEVAELKQNK